jgi:hypothetical protein
VTGRVTGARPNVRNAWVHVLFAALGLLIVVLAALDRHSRGGEDVLVAPEAAPLAPRARAEAVLLAPSTRLDEPDPDVPTRSMGARVEAEPEGEVAREVPSAAPEPEVPRQDPTPKSEEVIFIVRVFVRAEAGAVPSQWEDATVTARFAGTDAAHSASTPLGRAVVIEVPRKGASPVPGACEVVVSHPGYCLHRSSLDMDRVHSEGRDPEGRVRIGVNHSVRLERYAARLTGRTDDAERVALVAFSALRPPEPLEIVDIGDTSGGSYTLRVPSPGEWIVVALRAEAHPTYAIVDVLRSVEAGAIAEQFVPHQLYPLDTQLRVEAILPGGYDPTGLAVVLTPADQSSEAVAKEREAACRRSAFNGLPALGWHRTRADTPRGEAWGVDLRHREPQAEYRESIVWLSSSAQLDEAGGAIVRGGPTGAALVQVQDPFHEGRWEPGERREFAPLDTTHVIPPVARIDVRAFDHSAPLAGGKAHADWGGGRRTARAGRTADNALGAPRDGLEARATLDAEGRAALIVPSRNALTVTVLDQTGSRSALRRTTAPAPAGVTLVTLTVEALVTEPTKSAEFDGRRASPSPR